MVSYRLGLRLIVALVVLTTTLACSPTNLGAHESTLLLQFSGNGVVPSTARTREGELYTGPAFGTLFGENGGLDCAEWQGSFRNGKPHGEFKLHQSCNGPATVVWYINGVKSNGA